ncbi:MAG: TraR/DksA C4-type zinc finger protein [Desulfuromonadaceae bacterium]|nr:TraR/DksA C4-type zinc finger protein [Desulfuromonadaceae bacterium]
MTPDQLEHFRQLLEAQRQELLASKDAARDSTRPVTLDQASVGRLSRMDAMQGQAMAIASQRRRDLQLQRIHAALARMQSEDYGLCIACEEEIAIRRLETDPAATLCIDCASRQERR